MLGCNDCVLVSRITPCEACDSNIVWEDRKQNRFYGCSSNIKSGDILLNFA
jgi:hypothetical protein